MKYDIQLAAMKASPVAAVSVWHQINESLPTFIQWGTAIYIVLQIFVLVRKAWRERKQ